MSATSTQIGGDHYRPMSIQPERFIYENGIGFHEGSAIKYLCRWRRKGGVQDLEKAKHFIDLLIAHQEAEPEKAEAPKPEPPDPALPRLNTGWKWAANDGSHIITQWDEWLFEGNIMDDCWRPPQIGVPLMSGGPLATPDWHNPENIADPGEGYRFLVKGENKLSGDQLHMGKCSWKPSDLLRFPSVEVGQTYRTLATRPLPPVLADEKEAQP